MTTTFAGPKDALTDNLLEPFSGETAMKANIHCGDGNLVIDRLAGGEPVLASGALQYFEKQGAPTRSLDTRSGQANFTLKAGAAARPWFHFPWSACNGATVWQIHLNPSVALDLTVHSDGGNVRLDLTSMLVTQVAAETGGGNVELSLPDATGNLSVSARTGGGNVTIVLPGNPAARVYATSGLGKVIMDARFEKLDAKTYQTPDFEHAAHKVEINAQTGAGNVTISGG